MRPRKLSDIILAQNTMEREVFELFMKYSPTMGADAAFENILYAWASLSRIVRQEQPEYFHDFKHKGFLKIYQLIMSGSPDTTAELILKEEFAKLGLDFDTIKEKVHKLYGEMRSGKKET